MVYLVGCFDRNLELRVPSPRASPCPRAMAGIFFSSFFWLAVYFFLSELLQYLSYTYKALVHCSFDVAWHYHGRTSIRGFCCFRFCKANVLISVKCFYGKLERFKFFDFFLFPFGLGEQILLVLYVTSMLLFQCSSYQIRFLLSFCS